MNIPEKNNENITDTPETTNATQIQPAKVRRGGRPYGSVKYRDDLGNPIGVYEYRRLHLKHPGPENSFYELFISELCNKLKLKREELIQKALIAFALSQ